MDLVWNSLSHCAKTVDVVVQMYESEENGQVLEEELATILKIMLGVKEVDLSRLFLALGRHDTGKIIYSKTHCLFDVTINR